MKRHVEIIKVTPKIADQWLKKNTNNRELRKGLVATYAEAMKRGQWKLTPEPIVFCAPYRDRDTLKQMGETLMDGQHRLHAVIASGVTVEMTVWFGCDAEEFEVIGLGRRRTVGDILSLTHTTLKDPFVTASVANGFARYFLSYNKPVEPWMVQQLLGHYSTDFAAGAAYKHRLGRLAQQPAIAALMAGRFVMARVSDELVAQIASGIGFKENDAGRRIWQYLNDQALRMEGKDSSDTIFYKVCNGVAQHLQKQDCFMLHDRPAGLEYLRTAAKDRISNGLRLVWGNAIPANFFTPVESVRRARIGKKTRETKAKNAA